MSISTPYPAQLEFQAAYLHRLRVEPCAGLLTDVYPPFNLKA